MKGSVKGMKGRVEQAAGALVDMEVTGYFTACMLALLIARSAAMGSSPDALGLGSATGFAVLAGSTATSTGNTVINGDLGLSPGTSVTGTFTVNGTIYVANPVVLQAKEDLDIAYNDAASRTNFVLVGADLSGQQLGPGIYRAESTLEISAGSLTLDSGGQTNALFIFQIGSTLTTAAASAVVLVGGATSADVFWQVGTSATLGTSSAFQGTIMADQSITLTTGATVEGRILARHGAVTLDANTVTTYLPVTLLSADEVGSPYEYAAAQVQGPGTRTITVPKTGPVQFYRLLAGSPLAFTSIVSTGSVVRVEYAWTWAEE